MNHNTSNLAQRYALLRAEIQRRLATKEKWSTLPGLLDEMHALRAQVRARQGQRVLN